MELLDKKLSVEKQSALDAILAKIPASEYVTVDLPSKGLFYKTKEPVQVRPLGWEDEKHLVTQKSNDHIINVLIDSALRGIKCKDLIPMDRTFILFKLREITVGPEYEIKITCPHCQKLGEVGIDTSDFNVNYLPKDTQDPREITLPVSKIKMAVRFPKGVDEAYFAQAGLALDNLWRLIEHIDGVTDAAIKAAVVKKLPAPDLQFMRRWMHLDEYGLDTKFMYACAECSMETLMEAPIGPDFFLKN